MRRNLFTPKSIAQDRYGRDLRSEYRGIVFRLREIEDRSVKCAQSSGLSRIFNAQSSHHQRGVLHAERFLKRKSEAFVFPLNLFRRDNIGQYIGSRLGSQLLLFRARENLTNQV